MTEDADKVAKTRVDYYIRDGDSKAQFGIKSNGEVYVSICKWISIHDPEV